MVIETNNIYGKIVDRLNPHQLQFISDACSFAVQGAEFMKFSKSSRYKHFDGYKRLFNKQTRRFPIGLLARVTTICSNWEKVDIVDKRIHLKDVYQYQYDDSILRDYQREALIASLVNGNGILKVATGGGKTVIAGCTIGALQKKSIFIVHTRDLLYQAKESFQRLFPAETIGQIGDGIIDYQNITVATMQTLAILGDVEVGKSSDEDESKNEAKIQADKIKKQTFAEYAKTVQCVMMDEVQIVCSQTAQGVRFLFPASDYAFGYSASPWRDDGSDLAIEAAFGQRIIDINATKLINLGYLVRPTILVHKTTYPVYNQGNYAELYKRYIVENDERNSQVADDALWAYRQGMNTLILVTQIKHGEYLERLIELEGVHCDFISGKSGMKKRKQAIQDMRDGKISLLIASTIADVGLDIPRLQCIVEAGAGKSSVTALQRLGRIMRPFKGKDSCLFISYRDRCKYIDSHIDKKLEIWRTEDGFIINEEDHGNYKMSSL
jgi:superfamily II DNA or RNA helicase